MIQPISAPVSKELLQSEISALRRLCTTRRGGCEVYCFRAADAPAMMREVGRLREEAFRAEGGGTGCEVDIDSDDTAEDGYTQLVVWHPERCEILGGYRYIICRSTTQQHLSTEHYFTFSPCFRTQFLPYTLELGRSFVPLSHQATRRSGVFAQDNLWDGLGAVVAANPDVHYLLGKVTVFASYKPAARELLMYFLRRFFRGGEELVRGKYPLPATAAVERLNEVFCASSYEENYKILVEKLRTYGEVIPPMIHSYMTLSRTMRVFDTVRNDDFGGVEETGILLTVADIDPDKRRRYIGCVQA